MGGEEKRTQAIALLQRYHGGHGWQNPSRLQGQVWSGLKDLLPKGTLRKLMNDRPEIFQVRPKEGSAKEWEFTLIWGGGLTSHRIVRL